MAAKFFCDKCGREIFQHMNEEQKRTTTIAEIEEICVCSDCALKEAKEAEEEE